MSRVTQNGVAAPADSRVAAKGLTVSIWTYNAVGQYSVQFNESLFIPSQTWVVLLPGNIAGGFAYAQRQSNSTIQLFSWNLAGAAADSILLGAQMLIVVFQ